MMVDDRKLRKQIANDLISGLKDIEVIKTNADGSMEIKLTPNMNGIIDDMVNMIWKLYEARASNYGIVIYTEDFKREFINDLRFELMKYVQERLIPIPNK